MKINRRAHVFLLLALALLLTSSSLWAEEDGKGTNVVKNLRVVPNGTMKLGAVAITNWVDLPTATGAVSLAAYETWTNTVHDATNALNTAVTNVSYQVTNDLHNATNALNTSVTNLNARTNAWNNGVVITTGLVTTISYGKLYYMGGGSVWSNANASTNITAQGLIGLALGTESPPYINGLLLNGQFTTNSHGFALGALLYMQTNNNLITATRPFRTNHVVRIVGYVIDANTIMFNPDRTYIEILSE